MTRSFKSPVWELLKGCRVYDLSQPLEEGIPVSPNHPGFRLALKRRHGDAQRADGSSSANELLMLGGHTGTHIDALCHVSHQGMLHGGVNAFEAQRGGRFAQLGVETIAPILCRGVMLDLPAFMGVEILEPGAPVTANDLEAVAQRQGVQVQAGDAVLVRTGWGHLWKDPQAFEGESSGTPGPEESAARWLAELGVRLTGGETLAYEQIVAESGHSQLPVHRILLVEAGIHIVESMQLCELAHEQSLRVLIRSSTGQDCRGDRNAGTSIGNCAAGRKIITLTETLASFAADVQYQNLPPPVTSSIRKRLLDLSGVALAACPLPTTQMIIRLASGWGGAEEATVIGMNQRLPAMGAAFVNGVLAHSLDFDDTHLPSILHPSACVIPAALAVAEARGASCHQMVAAAAAGYEVGVRTAMAAYDPLVRDSVFFRRGWHATSVCGTLASATVAAVLYGLDASGIANAIGIAASMASGILEGNRAGGTVKRLHCGWAGHAGVIAAQSALAGITAPSTALEGRFGLFRACCGDSLNEDSIEDSISDGLGERWCVPSILFKPYPANHFTHAGIDAALSLASRLDPEEIEEIELRVPAPVLRTIAEPRTSKLKPETGYDAQFSGPFTVAAAFLGGGGLGLWLDDFSDRKTRDKRYLELAARVNCIADAELEPLFPHQLPAVLRVRTREGVWHQVRVLHNRGSSRNPLSDDELMEKFLANAQRRLSEEAARTLAASLLDPNEQPVAAQTALTYPDSGTLA